MSALKSLTELVQFRIDVTSKQQILDLNGNVKIEEVSIFKPEDIQRALSLSLSAFNMTPPVTYLKFTDEENMEQLSDLLVTYAAHLLLTKQSLLERGREFQVKDNGIGFVPPSVSDLAINISNTLWHTWDLQVRNLKESTNFYEDFVKEAE